MSPSSTIQTVYSGSPAETRAVATSLAGKLGPGDVVALVGELGAGKTCFVQGLAEATGVTQPVTSPTFALVNEYDGRPPMIHIDLYRIGDPEEAIQLGLEEYFEGPGITVVEWADRAAEVMPPRTWHVTLDHGTSENLRTLTLQQGRHP